MPVPGVIAEAVLTKRSNSASSEIGFCEDVPAFDIGEGGIVYTTRPDMF
jgi:hypothetical protein